MNGYEYDREAVLDELDGLADVRLEGSTTLRVTIWDDGDFQAVVFHTIDATYPHEAEARGDAQGEPFYRERLTFSTSGPEEGWICHEVVRRRCGETAVEVVRSERVGGYTFNWPAPIEDDDDENDDGPTYPGSTFPGRFA